MNEVSALWSTDHLAGVGGIGPAVSGFGDPHSTIEIHPYDFLIEIIQLFGF